MAPGDALAEPPRLHALETFVRDVAFSRQFLRTRFDLGPVAGAGSALTIGDVLWRLLPGAKPCGTRGPHGALPAFQIDDFGVARGYLQTHDIRVVFEEMLPGANLLVFLDPDDTPIELIEFTDPQDWDVQDRREVRTRRRRDQAAAGPLPLFELAELTIYTHDVTASARFYRELLGLPAGLSFFGHIHLAAANCALVLRSTLWQCRAPHQPHATEPVFLFSDLDPVLERLAEAGQAFRRHENGRVDLTDPAGVRLHLQQDGGG